MKILFTEIEPWQKPLLEKAFPEDTVYTTNNALSPDLLKKYTDSDILSVFIDSKINKEVIAQLPNLQLIVTRSTGFDHIDVAQAAQRNIMVCNAPTYATTAVAEYTFALILALVRMLYTTCYQVKQQQEFDRKGLRGFELKGKTIGIIGIGNIGKEVARIAHGFGMTIVVYDIGKDEALAKQLPITYLDLPALLSTADIITLHVPLNRYTYHLINEKNIHTIKRGAFLINTARGALVDTKALLTALQKGILAGAALDVLENYNTPESIELLANQCVLITPHNAYNTHDANQRLLESTITTIKAFQQNKPVHVINPKEVCDVPTV